MGASESTAKTNYATGDDEEKRRQQQSSAGTSIGDAVALAAAGMAAVGVTAWSISKMLSEQNSADSHQNNNNQMQVIAATMVLAGVGVAAVGIGIAIMLSEQNTTDSQQKDVHHGTEYSSLLNSSGDMMIKEGKGRYHEERSIWSPPPIGRLKMNTDGSCHPIHGLPHKKPQDVLGNRVKRGPSGYGGILRDHCGNWVRGFRGFIDKETDCLTAELHGIHKGLELLDKLGHKGAILESDCQGAVDWINKEWDDPNACESEIIRGCSDIIKGSRSLRRKNNTSVTHVIGQNANQCADKLANLAIDKEDEYVEIVKFSELPYGVKHLVSEDKKAIGYSSNNIYG